MPANLETVECFVKSCGHPMHDWLQKQLLVVRSGLAFRTVQAQWESLGRDVSARVSRDTKHTLLAQMLQSLQSFRVAVKAVASYMTNTLEAQLSQKGISSEDPVAVLSFHATFVLQLEDFYDAVRLTSTNFLHKVNQMKSDMEEKTQGLTDPNSAEWWRHGLADDCNMDDIKAATRLKLKQLPGGSVKTLYDKHHQETEIFTLGRRYYNVKPYEQDCRQNHPS